MLGYCFCVAIIKRYSEVLVICNTVQDTRVAFLLNIERRTILNETRS